MAFTGRIDSTNRLAFFTDSELGSREAETEVRDPSVELNPHGASQY
jgi:hypothetical protein